MNKIVTEEEKHYLLQFLLACCSVQDSIDEESRGEKMACFMVPKQENFEIFSFKDELFPLIS